MSQDKPATPVRKSVKDDTLLLSLVTQYFKYAGVVLAVWIFGYFGFSPAWLLLGLVVFIWKEKHTKEQKKKIEISQQAARNEQEAILARVEDLPSWVFFPDVERAEWLNKIIEQVWPFIGDYVRDLLMTTVQEKVQQSASVMGSFKFINIDLGDIPPRIGGVKVYTQHVRRDEIYMDLDIIYSSDSQIEVKIKGLTAGIKDLQLHGTLRVIFKPLLSTMPLFGGISVFFLNNPSIDFNLTSLANALDLPGLNDMLHTIIQENIANIMVLPNRIPIVLAPNLDISRLKYPQPDGVLRIHIVEAKDLEKADISILGKGKSDPYIVVRVGALKFKTQVINNSLAPVWNEVYEAIIDQKEGQFMEVEVKDEDPGSKDDKLGTVSIDLSPCSKKGLMDSWLPLENVKTGMLHMRLVWLYLSKDPSILNKTMQKLAIDQKTTSEDLSACLLMVNLDSARELPLVEDSGWRSKKMLEPSPYVMMGVSQAKEESNIMVDTTEPRWEQGFRFLVNDPNFQTLDVKVMDKKTDRCLGELTVPLKNLLSSPDMVQDQYYQLKKSETNSQIQMRLSLRVLTTEFDPNWIDEKENLSRKVTETTTPKTDKTDPKAAGSKVDKPSGATKDEVKPGSPQGAKGTTPTPAAAGSKQPSSPLSPGGAASEGSELRQRKSTASTESVQGEHQLGRIQLTLRYSTQRQKLVVVIHKCTGLVACDSDHFSDPYVKIYLQPDKSSKKKTNVIKNNLNPLFDETFEYGVASKDLVSRTLEVTVKNDTSVFSSSETVLGVINIDMATLDTSKAVTEWYDLMPKDTQKKRPVSMESDV